MRSLPGYRGKAVQSKEDAVPKVLMLSCSYPKPPDIGRRVVSGGILRFLCRFFGPENVIFVCVGDVQREGAEPLECRTVFVPLDALASRAWRTLIEGLLLKQRALQETSIYTSRARKVVSDLLKRENVNTVVVDTLRVSRYVEDVPAVGVFKIMYLDDLYSLRLQRQYEAMDIYGLDGLNALGTFGRFFPSFVGRMLSGGRLQRRLLRAESRLLCSRETEVTKHYDKVLLVNAQEVQILTCRAARANVHWLKPAIRFKNASPVRRLYDGQPTFMFLGNLEYQPNRVSLDHFIERALPGAIRLMPDLKLVVVGRCPAALRVAYQERWAPSVEILGFVENLGSLFGRVAALIAPVLYGSGLKIKVLEALSSGVPVITMPSGVDGLDVASGRECLIVGDISEFPEAMRSVTALGVNRAYSRAALRYFDESFSADALEREYRELFSSS